MFEGHKYAYVVGYKQIYRYEWDGKKLAQDTDWGPVTYVKPGQGQSGASVVMNDWVTIQTNGLPGEAPMSVVAISQADSSKVERIEPTPSLKPGQLSCYFAHGGVDPENDRIYALDACLNTVSAIDFRNGKMSLAWQAKQRTNSYPTLIGSQDERVFVDTNIKPDVGVKVTELNAGPKGANYMEQIQWRNAQNGKLLAASGFYPPAASAAAVPPGYGGMIYDILQDGRVVPLYVHPEE